MIAVICACCLLPVADDGAYTWHLARGLRRDGTRTVLHNVMVCGYCLGKCVPEWPECQRIKDALYAGPGVGYITCPPEPLP